MAPPPNRGLLQLRGAQDFEINRIIQIVAVISDLIRQVRDLRLERGTPVFFSIVDRRVVKRLVLLQALSDLESQVQPGKSRIGSLEQFDHPLALPVMVEAAVL